MQGLVDSNVVGSRSLAIETSNLGKRHPGGFAAVDGVNLRVSRGGVYGFLGINGAGKTTVLKMLLGLTEPTSGTIRVLDEAPGTMAALSRVGAMIESPDFYPYLSGRENLKMIARYAGVPLSRSEEVLGQVGLKEKAGTAFRKYSLGMKQRLGVAAALMKNPELLLLDEPTSGLDVRGMSEMRQLIQKLGDDSRTVLFSSHLMSEVEQVCDRVGVIHRGNLVAEGSMDDLRQQGGIELRVESAERAREVAEQVEGVDSARVWDDKLLLAADPELIPEVVYALAQSKVRIKEARPGGVSLEELFLKLTEDREGE